MTEEVTCVTKESFFKETPTGAYLRAFNRVVVPVDPMPEQESFLSPLYRNAVDKIRSPELEQDESLLQIIPYVVVRDADGNYLTYYRRGAEGRLHGYSSIGFGGHVKLDTSMGQEEFEESLGNEMMRELREEVDISPEDYQYLQCIGMIYNPADEVGRVHLGIVYLVRLPYTWNLLISDECGEVKALPASDILQDDPEPWTKLALECIYNYEAVKSAMESTQNKMTRFRVAGEDSMFVDPQRELSVVAASLLENAWNVIMADSWPGGAKVAGIDIQNVDDRRKIRTMLESIESFVRIANRQIHPEVESMGKALELAGYFNIPSEVRMLVLSHLGLNLLSELWVAVRQMVGAGIDPGVEYGKATAQARRFMQRAVYGQESEDAAVDNFVRSQIANGLDLRSILSMVGDSYRQQKEASPVG